MAYFSYFPNIFYRGHITKNIVARTAVPPTVFQDVSVFYPYEVKEGDRPDITSQRIYQTPFNDWMIYLTNNVVDPYYDWYLSQQQFENHIQMKYGSVDRAKNTIAFYRVNWLQDDSALTISGFEQLPSLLKKYWEAVYDELTGVIIKYVRKQMDTMQNTNRIQSIDIILAGADIPAIGEVLVQRQLSTIATAVVVSSSNTNIVVQHTTGSFDASYSLEGQTSGATAVITNIQTLIENISASEAVYWSPVTYYELEEENNEYKRTVQLIAPRYSSVAQDQFKQLLSR